MDPRRTCLTLLAAAAMLAVPGAARAAWFPAEPIDGPSSDIVGLGGIDMARDGTGALTYVRYADAVPHVFVSRTWLGVWRTPERVDAGVAEAGEQPVVAVGENGTVAVAWISAGRLYASVATGSVGQPFSAPQVIAENARDPHLDLGINGTAYVVWTAGGGDVRAARLMNGTWEQVGAPLDIDPGQAAGDGTGRPRVAVSAEGYAVAVWGESHADGRRRIYSRRVTGLTLSVAPQEVSLPTFDGQPGGPADSADMDIEDDGSYAWVTFRQDIGGASRVLARRLVGSTFDPAVYVDGGPGSSAGRVAMNGKGIGLAASAAPDGGVAGSLLELDMFGPVARWSAPASTAGPQPVVGAGDNDDVAVAWLRGADGVPAAVYGRHRLHDTPDFAEETLLSQPGYGLAAPDGRLEMASSRLGDFAVAFLQGPPLDRRLVVASFDRPPGLPFGLSNSKPRKDRRPRLKWRPGVDLWGAQSFKVMLDGAELTTTDRSFVRPPQPLADGAHLWQVISSDRRGQVTEMKPRVLQIDATAPEMSVKISGSRRVGGLLTVRIRATDPAGLKSRWIEYGDGTKAPVGSRSIKRYARAGAFRMTVRVRDKARNVAKKVVRVRIRR